MIATQFDYQAPETLADAIALLSSNRDEAKLLAGGHSLIPAMKLRLAQPQLLIDLGRIKDLSYIREEGNEIRIGAMTTHYDLESSSFLRTACPLLTDCAAHIGDVQVRNKGTIGGSIAHADPAGDWPAAVIALSADLVVTGVNGERTIKADDFFVDMLTTALASDEILREVRIAKPRGRFGHSYQKVPHPASGFAVIGVAINLIRSAEGSCDSLSVGVTGVASKAYRASGVELALNGKQIDDAAIAAAAKRVCEDVDANSDLYASAEYRKHLAEVYTRRGIAAAAQSALSK